jgi:hypothetical protein
VAVETVEHANFTAVLHRFANISPSMGTSAELQSIRKRYFLASAATEIRVNL